MSLSSSFAAYPGEPNVFVSAVEWIQAALLGSVATAVATIAVAAVGFLMLSGRLRIKRGVTVILGCFILFGASAIADGLRRGTGGGGAGSAEQPVSAEAAPIATPIVPPNEPAPLPADPYAGAALRR